MAVVTGSNTPRQGISEALEHLLVFHEDDLKPAELE